MGRCEVSMSVEDCLAPGSLESRDCPERGAVAGIYFIRISGVLVSGSWRWAVGRERCVAALAHFRGVNTRTVVGWEPSLWCY